MENIKVSMSGVSIHRLRMETLSELAAKLIQAGASAKEKTTKTMVASLKSAAQEFNTAKATEKTNQSTQITSQYIDTMKKRYTALGGCLTTAKNCGIKEKEAVANKIIPKYAKMSSVFALKSETIGRMEKAIANLRTIKDEDFVTIGALELLENIESVMEEYRSAVISRVDVKVEKSKSVVTARLKLTTAIQGLLSAVKYAQDCLNGSETELVKQYNTIFSEIAALLKLSATLRAKNKKEAEENN